MRAHEYGCVENFLSYGGMNGWIPVRIDRNAATRHDQMMARNGGRIYRMNMHKPCLAQHAAFLVSQGGGPDNDPTAYYRPPRSCGSIFLNSFLAKEYDAMLYRCDQLGYPAVRVATSVSSSWLGPVWGISNYLVFRGLLRYGYESEARELAEKTVVLFGRDIEQTGAMHEYCEPETGKAILNHGFQNWNLLVLCMIAWLRGDHPVSEF